MKKGWFTQVCSAVNARAHEDTTGPELLERSSGRIEAFVAGAGTGGTITGVGRFLKRHLPNVRVVFDVTGASI